MSNTERQRRFRERNPGYYGRLHARQRAEIRARQAQLKATAKERQPLMLSAPVQVLEIPGLNAIPATMPARERVAVAVVR